MTGSNLSWPNWICTFSRFACLSPIKNWLPTIRYLINYYALISLAVAAIPEGLPIVVTVTFASSTNEFDENEGTVSIGVQTDRAIAKQLEVFIFGGIHIV